MDINKFAAGPRDGRYPEHPFALDGHAVATNGLALIVAPGQHDLKPAPLNLLARLRELMAIIQSAALSPVELPALPPISACSTCYGMEWTLECSDCDGRGQRYTDESSIDVAGVLVPPASLALLAGTPDITVGPVEDRKLLAFRSGKYSGALYGQPA